MGSIRIILVVVAITLVLAVGFTHTIRRFVTECVWLYRVLIVFVWFAAAVIIALMAKYAFAVLEII